jgi:molybdate transport system substrate-binding protein
MASKKSILTAIVAVLVIAVIIIAAVSLSTPSSPGKTQVTVFAAASLTAVFTEMASDYEKNHTNVNLSFDFDGSATLKTQLLNGATADIFASADYKNLNAASAAHLMDNSTIQTFAKNRLVVIVPASNPAGITSLTDLTRSGVKIVMGDTTVPIGNYTRTFLKSINNSSSDYTDFQSRFMSNVVSQESVVTSIVTKVSLGEADAGVVYATDARTAGSKVVRVTIPDAYNVIAVYPMGKLAGAAHPTEADGFISYVMSADGQSVMTKYGFITVV